MSHRKRTIGIVPQYRATCPAPFVVQGALVLGPCHSHAVASSVISLMTNPLNFALLLETSSRMVWAVSGVRSRTLTMFAVLVEHPPPIIPSAPANRLATESRTRSGVSPSSLSSSVTRSMGSVISTEKDNHCSVSLADMRGGHASAYRGRAQRCCAPPLAPLASLSSFHSSPCRIVSAPPLYYEKMELWSIASHLVPEKAAHLAVEQDGGGEDDEDAPPPVEEELLEDDLDDEV